MAALVAILVLLESPQCCICWFVMFRPTMQEILNIEHLYQKKITKSKLSFFQKLKHAHGPVGKRIFLEVIS
jgi:hypothetical protein